MKDFDSWNEEKKNLENFGNANLPFSEGQIWWCSFGYNIGDEEDGKNAFFERPALVVKKFNNRLCWVLPTTSQQKRRCLLLPNQMRRKNL